MINNQQKKSNFHAVNIKFRLAILSIIWYNIFNGYVSECKTEFDNISQKGGTYYIHVSNSELHLKNAINLAQTKMEVYKFRKGRYHDETDQIKIVCSGYADHPGGDRFTGEG